MRPRCIGRQSRGARLGLRLTTPLLALVAVTAVWGVTFVQVKDAVAIYPLVAFLALRFVLAALVLGPPGVRRVPSLGRGGGAAAGLLGLLLAAGYVLQTAGLERTTVSGTGFVTGMYVVLTPVIALALFRARIGRAACRTAGPSGARFSSPGSSRARLRSSCRHGRSAGLQRRGRRSHSRWSRSSLRSSATRSRATGWAPSAGVAARQSWVGSCSPSPRPRPRSCGSCAGPREPRAQPRGSPRRSDSPEGRRQAGRSQSLGGRRTRSRGSRRPCARSTSPRASEAASAARRGV